MDFMMDDFTSLNELVGICGHSPDDVDYGAYMDFVAGQAVALFDGVSGQDCDLLSYLEDVDLMPVDTTAKLKGDGLGACYNSGCRLK